MKKRRRVNPARPKLIRGQPLLSEYPGVTYERGVERRGKPWKAYIVRNGKQINLGRFFDESGAREARRQATLKDW